MAYLQVYESVWICVCINVCMYVCMNVRVYVRILVYKCAMSEHANYVTKTSMKLNIYCERVDWP